MTSQLIQKAVETLEKMKKTGIHEFEVGYNRCKCCGVERVIVDRQSLLIIEDKESGGSSREVSTTEYNMEGGPCLKNYGGERNQAISDIQSLLPQIITGVIEESQRDLLDRYSQFLEKKGYMDCDWYAEEPHTVDAFLALKEVVKE